MCVCVYVCACVCVCVHGWTVLYGVGVVHEQCLINMLLLSKTFGEAHPPPSEFPSTCTCTCKFHSLKCSKVCIFWNISATHTQNELLRTYSCL